MKLGQFQFTVVTLINALCLLWLCFCLKMEHSDGTEEKSHSIFLKQHSIVQWSLTSFLFHTQNNWFYHKQYEYYHGLSITLLSPSEKQTCTNYTCQNQLLLNVFIIAKNTKSKKNAQLFLCVFCRNDYASHIICIVDLNLGVCF